MLEVIGAGFGRTGTHSLGLALEKLGYGPCYNIQQVAKNREHNDIWNDAMNGRSVDWNFLFADYRSAVEWPAVAFLPELTSHFPDAKVILTLRNPESWFESANATMFYGLELSAHNPDPIKRERGSMARRLILERTFDGKYRDKDHAIQIYKKHILNVVKLTPSNRLLQFNVKEGWEPLCAFLDRSTPDEPFPRLNERTEFLASAPEWTKKIKKDQ